MRFPALTAVVTSLVAAGALHACSSSGSSPARPPAADAAPADAAPIDDAGDAGTVVIATDAGTPIAPTAFGHNYWDWVDWSNDGLTGLTGTAPIVQPLHLNVLRAGGDNNDQNSPQLFDATQIDAFVQYCHDVGAEPILQVPLVANNEDGGAATADTAAAMVTYANVTKGYGIKYWEIGNEPDIYPMQYDASFPVQSAAAYCTAYSTYAAAMRAANAAAPDGGVAMQFLGPELAYKYTSGSDDWLSPFLDGCKDDVDVVSIHRYPFSGQQTTVRGALNDVSTFRQVVASVQSIVQGHARPGTPLAITEANISYDYATSSYTDASLQAAPGTFYAALWTADIAGAALETNLWTLAFWNLGEIDGPNSLLGFVVDQTPVPAFYAQQMISANFRGTVLRPKNVPTGFSVYASHDPAASSTAVVVLNKTSNTSRMGIAVDALAAQAFDFPALSITLVQIPDAPGGATHVVRYGGDQADAGAGPITIQ
jgi:hypothetical protein